MKKHLLIFISLLIIGTASALAVWNAPSQDPPGANTDAPINTGGIGQIKEGGISVGANSSTTVGLRVLNGSVGIGIGSNTPAQKLHVGGFIRADSGFCIAGACKMAWIDSVTGGPGINTSPSGGASGSVVLSIAHPNFSCPSGRYLRAFNLTDGTMTCDLIP